MLYITFFNQGLLLLLAAAAAAASYERNVLRILLQVYYFVLLRPFAITLATLNLRMAS